MLLKVFGATGLGANLLAAFVTTAVAITALSVTGADAAPKKRVIRDGVVARGPNYSYQAGPRTRVYVTRRSWLDAGTEVLPGERKFNDYALPPGYNYGRNIDRLNQGRNPLSDPYDLGGYPTRFPLY